MPTVLQELNVPGAIRSRSSFAAPDYVDLFTVTTSGVPDLSPEEWVRAAVEDAAGLKGQFVWRGVLGLRLAVRQSADCIGGWKIAGRGDTWIRLEAASWFLTAQIVVEVDEGLLSVATFVRYDRPIAAIVWPPISVVHRQAMPGLLRHAVRMQQGKAT